MDLPDPPSPASGLSGRALRRYSRHLLLPGFSEATQARIARSRVAVVGAGGLGSPVLQYLAAAGVGHVTVVDPDRVESSNLQRQVIHSEKSLGMAKVASAAAAVRELNSEVEVREIEGVLTPDNALEILGGHDLVLDGTDNFPTRYLVSDACEILNVPLVWGSILAFHGQVSVFWSDGGRGVTYRDVHPRPPRPGEVPSCSEAGVLGTLVGVIGSTMAMEALKVLTGLGEPMLGRITVYDALAARWSDIEVERTPGREPVTEIEDLVETCGFPAVPGPSDGVDATADLEVLSPSEAAHQAAAGRVLIDVREDSEVAGGMLPHAVHVPKDDLLAFVRGERAAAGPWTRAEDIEGAVVYCQGGTRSAAVQAECARVGIAVADLAGGYAAATQK